MKYFIWTLAILTTMTPPVFSMPRPESAGADFLDQKRVERTMKHLAARGCSFLSHRRA